MKKIFFILIVLAAKKAFTQDTIYLKEITISDKYNYFNLIKLDSLKLQNILVKDIAELLQNEAGISIRKYGYNNLQTISIRGTQSHHNIILWNGMPIFSPLNGQVNLSTVIYQTDNQLFIGYNTFGQAYISGAFGGIVYLNTSLSQTDKTNVNVNLQYESLKNKCIYLSNLLNLKAIKVKNSLMIQHNNNEFIYFNNAVLPKLKTKNHSESKQFTYNNELYFRKKDITFNISNQFQKSFYEIPPLMTSLYQVKHEEWNAQQTIQSVLHFNYKNSFSIIYGFRFAKMNYNLSRYLNNLPITLISSITHEPTMYFSINYKKKINSKTTLYWSTKYQQLKGFYKDKLHSIEFNKQQHRIELSKILEKNWKNINQIIQLSILNYQNKINILPSIIHKYFASEKFELTHSAGYNIRIPYLNELYFIPGGNQLLRPEKALQNNIICKYKPTNNLDIKISPHHSVYKDWIFWQPTSFGYWEAKNIRKINIYGIDFSTTNNITRGNNFFYQIFSYTLNLAKGYDEIYLITHIPYIPMHTISLFLQYSYKSFKINNDISWYSQRYPLSYDKYFTLEPILLWNANVQYQFKLLTYSIGVENILNTSYQNIIWRPMPGRFYKFSISYKFTWDEK